MLLVRPGDLFLAQDLSEYGIVLEFEPRSVCLRALLHHVPTQKGKA